MSETPVMTAEEDSPRKGDAEEGESLSTEGSSPEKKLLSRKALQTIRKIKSLKKALMVSDVRGEIEELFGKDALNSIPSTIQDEDHHDEDSVGKMSGNEDSNSATGASTGNDTSQEDVEMDTGEKGIQDTALRIPERHTPASAATPSVINLQTQLGEGGTHVSNNSRDSSGKNVSIAAAVSSQNSHNLRIGNLQAPPSRNTPTNPYSRRATTQSTAEEGTLNSQRCPNISARLDKAITLKKNNSRPHIHRYTLRIKTIKAKSEDEGHLLLQEALQRFLEIVLQADSKSIVPPYIELDRNDRSVSDLSAAFPVSSIESFHVLKKYFFRLSPRDEEGISWCSIILAQSLPFSVFIDKAKYSLENNDCSLWPKASDNENTTDVGWLMYSTRAQDEERLSALLSEITGENIGVKWKPIRSSNASIRKKDQPPPEVNVKALHVECAVDRLQEVRDKLSRWYGSSSRQFPVGTKVRLVPTITSVNSMNNRTKFASCLAQQAALTAGLASAVTREISNNLLLDRKDPISKKSFRDILDRPGTTLFHTIDRQFKSDVIVNFQFHPESASEANNLIAGLVPYLKDHGYLFHLKMLTPEALQRQAEEKWNRLTREADSETDA